MHPYIYKNKQRIFINIFVLRTVQLYRQATVETEIAFIFTIVVSNSSVTGTIFYTRPSFFNNTYLLQNQATCCENPPRLPDFLHFL